MNRSIWIIFFGSLALLESASSAATTSSDPAVLRPDPFVEAAPLIVAVACRNGAVILAAHTLGSDEPLIYDSWLPEDSESRESDETVESTSCAFRNLPADYKGPFRIHSVDRCGSALVSSGWRADCEVLVEKCRSLSQIELNRFGPPSQLDVNYAHMIASDLSCYLAQCAVSERARTLCCAGLFVAPGTKKGASGRVWLIDATGAYPVRGLCIGGGTLEKYGGRIGRRISDHVNRKLLRIDWTQMQTDEALKTLVQLLAEKADIDHNAIGEIFKDDPISPSLLRESSRLEAVVVDSTRNVIVRTRVPVFKSAIVSKT